MTLFEKRKSGLIEFVNQNRVRVESLKQCKMYMNVQIMEEVSEFK